MRKTILNFGVCFCLGVCTGAGSYFMVNRWFIKPDKKQGQVIKKGKCYVFFSSEGKPVSLSERDVFDIKQMNEDGVLPTAIGDKFNMDPVMECRIINSIKTI